MNIQPVLLCGGVGARLWPASRPDLPKAFLALTGEHSGLQESLLRLAGRRGFAEPVVVAGAAHAEVARAQIAAVGGRATLLLEPGARDSAPAICAAAAFLAGRRIGGVAAFLPSDHFIPDADAFAAALGKAARGASDGKIVTLGVRPASPSVDFGYIRPGRPIGRGPILEVAQFVEKPAADLAARYVASGWLWNSGAFIARPDVLVAEFRMYVPAVSDAVLAGVREARPGPNAFWLSDAFLAAAKISIDYAVMEKTSRAAVLPVEFEWSDLGVWQAIHAASPQDPAGNAVEGDVLADRTSGCLIRAGPGIKIVAAGVRDLAIVASSGEILVSYLGATADMKAILAGGLHRVVREPTTVRRRRLRRRAGRRRRSRP